MMRTRLPPITRSSWFVIVFLLGLGAGTAVRAIGLPPLASIAAVAVVVIVGAVIPVEKGSPDPPPTDRALRDR